MKIKKSGENITVLTDEKSVLLVRKEMPKETNYSIIIDIDGVGLVGNNAITTPGEYEIADILFNVFSFGDKLDKPEIVFIDSDEDVRILYVAGDVAVVNKNLMEKLPDTNILIAEVNKENLTQKLEILSEIEPDIFIPIVDKGLVDELAKELGVSSIEIVPTLNISQKDFTEDSAELRVFLLKD
jgi:hypothetical protein